MTSSIRLLLRYDSVKVIKKVGNTFEIFFELLETV